MCNGDILVYTIQKLMIDLLCFLNIPLFQRLIERLMVRHACLERIFDIKWKLPEFIRVLILSLIHI